MKWHKIRVKNLVYPIRDCIIKNYVCPFFLLIYIFKCHSVSCSDLDSSFVKESSVMKDSEFEVI